MYTISINKIEDPPKLLEEIRDFYNVITSDSITDRLLPEGVDYIIDLELGERPLFRPLYNLLVKELAALREYLEQALKNR
jgi:hypothetical protein